LNKINIRIEKLLDKDHMIGHSYFLNINNINDIKIVFKNNIIPLLEEYFFGDYGKIGLVLGESFFTNTEAKNENIFARFKEYDSTLFEEKEIYRLKDLSAMDDEVFIKCLNDLIK
jgi:5-methylcytosine-specific restriction protein B